MNVLSISASISVTITDIWTKFGTDRVARSPVFSGSSRISAPISRLPDRSQNLPYLTRRSLASEINVLETFCSLLIVHSTIWSDLCREAYHGQKLPFIRFGRGYPPTLGNLPQNAISDDSNCGRNMPGNELIFAWLLAINKSYDVLQLGEGTPKWEKFGPKTEISNDSNCGQNI